MISRERLVEVIADVTPCSCDEMWVDEEHDWPNERAHDPECSFPERAADAILKAEAK